MSLSIDTSVRGIGSILEAGKLKVPHHQRVFAWTEEEVGQLWDDIQRAENSEEGYFIGPIVVGKEGTNQSLSVIDGQQRLATVSLLLAAIASHFSSNGGTDGAERAGIIDKDYLGSKNLETLEREPRLHLNGDDDGFFRALIQAAVSGEPLPDPARHKPSHGLILGAFDLLRSKVAALAQGAGANWEAELRGLVGFLKESVKVIHIQVGSSHNAYLIFETLNSRGSQLTTSDLLKNHLFGQAGQRLDQVRDDWSQMTATLAAIEGPETTPHFLRHYWISARGMVREKDLFKAISTEIRASRAAAEFSSGLTKSASSYAALATPSHPQWNSSEIRDALQVLQLFRVTTPRPLLLAALEELTGKQFSMVLRAVAAWSVRLAIVGGLGSGSAEDAFGEAARAIRHRKLRTVRDLRGAMKNLIPTDDTFRGAFSIKSLRNSRQSRYLLATLELEKQKAAGIGEERIPNLNEEKVNLEHIMPVSLGDEWPDIKDEEHSLLIHRLGNMALMLKTANAQAGQGSFAQKKEVYRRSTLILTKMVADQPEWGPDQISSRQTSLANLAVRAWRR